MVKGLGLRNGFRPILTHDAQDLDDIEQHDLILCVVRALKLALRRILDNLVDGSGSIDRIGSCKGGEIPEIDIKLTSILYTP